MENLNLMESNSSVFTFWCHIQEILAESNVLHFMFLLEVHSLGSNIFVSD